jgi:hypothetical protein
MFFNSHYACQLVLVTLERKCVQLTWIYPMKDPVHSDISSIIIILDISKQDRHNYSN